MITPDPPAPPIQCWGRVAEVRTGRFPEAIRDADVVCEKFSATLNWGVRGVVIHVMQKWKQHWVSKTFYDAKT